MTKLSDNCLQFKAIFKYCKEFESGNFNLENVDKLQSSIAQEYISENS